MNRAFKRTPQTYKGAAGETAVVDKVLLTSNDENHFIVKALIRQTRRPEVLNSSSPCAYEDRRMWYLLSAWMFIIRSNMLGQF